MQLLRTTRQLGQAVKNVHRLRQIVSVLSKHGFADVINRMNLGRFVPTRLSIATGANEERSISERTRHAMEELGPTFVKLGQLLSTRPDLVPENFIEEFKKLQDNVKPVPYEIIRQVLEQETKKRPEDLFAEFSHEPLAAASIGQVHEGTLKTGERVVVKIQRPEIGKIIENDISLLAFLAGLLEKYIPESRVVRPTVIVDEFFRTLVYELDYRIEANNMDKIRSNLAGIPEVVIPRVHKEYSGEKILVMERLDGLRVSDLKSLEAAGIDRKEVVRIGARAFFKMVLIDGLFHGDLHGGNLFVLPVNRIGVIDFGIVGRLSEKAREQLSAMVLALLSEDYENLCYQYAELGSMGGRVDFDAFTREVRNVLSPYLGLPLSQINAGRVLIEATRIASRHQISVPGDWMLVFKAIMTLEGMGRTLDPEFDFLAMGKELMSDLVKNQYSIQRITRDFAWVTRDTVNLIQTLPRQLKWMFRKFNSNDFAFEIKLHEFDSFRKEFRQGSRRVGLGLLGAGLMISASIALQTSQGIAILGVPWFAFLMAILGIIMVIRVWFS